MMTTPAARSLVLPAILLLIAALCSGSSSASSPTSRTKTTLIVELEAPSVYATDPNLLRSLRRGSTTTSTTSKRFTSTKRTVELSQSSFLARAKSALADVEEALVLRSGSSRPARFTTLVNAVAVRVDASTESEVTRVLQSLSGVKAVHRSRSFRQSLFASRAQVGSVPGCETPEVMRTLGAGVKVAVVDAGILTRAAMFAADPASGVGETSNNNAKVVVSRSYFRADDPPYDAQEAHTWPGPRSSSHGTHVASTAAGVFVNATVGPKLVLGLCGVAPGATLLNYRIFYFSRDGVDTANTPEILAALEDAVEDGADVINNSWGDYAMVNKNDPIAAAVRTATASGVVVVFAAGNSGPDPYTIDHYAPGIRVAAVTKSAVISAGRLMSNPSVGSFSFAVAAFSSSIPVDSWINLSAPSDADLLGCVAFSTSLYNFTSRAVLIKRGSCDFTVKVSNAMAAGASMVVVFNHEAGGEEMVNMAGDLLNSVPAVFVRQSAGLALLGLARNTDVVGQISVNVDPYVESVTQDIVTSFSSRGPTVDMQLAPDVAAPGDEILAQGFAQGQGMDVHLKFGAASGTSMASPHVAGAAAMVLQANPDFTPAQVRSALMSTAEWMGVSASDRTQPAQPLDVGAGRINVQKAMHPPLRIFPTEASFSLVKAGTVKTIVLDVQILASTVRAVDVSVVVHSAVWSHEPAPEWVSVSPSSLSSSGNVTVTFNSSHPAATFGDDMQAYVLFTNTSGDATTQLASVPLWGRIVCPGFEKDMLIIDADLSYCAGDPVAYPDQLPLYTAAANSAGLTYDLYNYTCDDYFFTPAKADLLCYKTVLMFVSRSPAPGPYLEASLPSFKGIVHSGVPVILMGSTLPELFGLDQTEESLSDSPLTYEFGGIFSSSSSLVKVVGTSNTEFAKISAVVKDLQAVVRPLQRLDGRQEQTVLFEDQSGHVLAHSITSNPSVKNPLPAFDSLSVISLVGLDIFPLATTRATTLSLMYRHATQTKPACTVVAKGSEPDFGLNITCSDSSFVISSVEVAWGDDTATTKNSPSHRFFRAGSYTPAVVVTTSLGRAFVLDASNVVFVVTKDTVQSSVTSSSDDDSTGSSTLSASSPKPTHVSSATTFSVCSILLVLFVSLATTATS